VKHINKKSPSRKGDMAEFYAVTWLWDNGYEVFKNTGCSGPIDLISIKDAINLIESITEEQNERETA